MLDFDSKKFAAFSEKVIVIMLLVFLRSESSSYDENCKKNFENPNIEISCFF